MKITSQNISNKSGLEALLSSPKTDFPNKHFLIQIFYTLSVSIIPEKSVSTLTRLKTYLRIDEIIIMHDFIHDEIIGAVRKIQVSFY
jgi:hypothetical protein